MTESTGQSFRFMQPALARHQHSFYDGKTLSNDSLKEVSIKSSVKLCISGCDEWIKPTWAPLAYNPNKGDSRAEFGMRDQD